MSAAVETPAPAPAAPASTPSTPAPSAPSPSPTPSTSSSSSGERPRLDPSTTWEEYRKAKGAEPGPTPDTPRVTPDSLKKYLDERRAKDAASDDTPEKADAPEPEKAEPVEAATPETPEAPPGPRTFKVKYRGQEQEVPVDKFAALVKLPAKTIEALADELGPDAVVQLYSRLHNGEESARELGNHRREWESVIRGLNASPVEVFDYLAQREGVSFDLLDTAYQIVQRDIEEKALTPDAKRAKAAEAKLAQLEARESRDKAERERILQEAHTRAEQNRVQTFVAELGEEIRGALADAKLPVDGYSIGLIEEALIRDQAAGGTAYKYPVGRAQMRQFAAAHVPAVRAKLSAAVKALYAEPTPETVEAFVKEHPELHAAAAKERVAAFKKNSTAQTKGGASGADNGRSTSTTPRMSDEWRDELRRRA